MNEPMSNTDILGEIQEEGTLDLDSPQVDSPSEDGQNEDTTPAVENKQTEEENVPFHEHPRFKELVEEKNTYKQEVEKIKEKLESLKPQENQTEQPTVPKEFTQLYGSEATEHWEAYKRLNQQTLDNVVTREGLQDALREEMQRVEQEKQEAAELTKKYKEEYDTRIEQSAEKLGIDKGKFRKWFVENPIVKQNEDDPQNWDYDIERGADIYAQINPPVDRGDVVNKTDNAPVQESGKYKSINDLARESWANLG